MTSHLLTTEYGTGDADFIGVKVISFSNDFSSCRWLPMQEEGLDTVDANRALGLPDDCREYTSVRNILADLGVRSIRLMVRPQRSPQADFPGCTKALLPGGEGQAGSALCHQKACTKNAADCSALSRCLEGSDWLLGHCCRHGHTPTVC